MSRPRRRRAPLAPGLAVLALAAAAPRAGAQSETEPIARAGYQELSPWTKLRSVPIDPRGQNRYSLSYLKFDRVDEGRLVLWGGYVDRQARPHPLEGLLTVPQAGSLYALLQAKQDSKKRDLVPRRTNIQVFGALRTVRGERVFTVEWVRQLHSHRERFELEHKAIKGDDPAQRQALVKRIQATVKPYPDDEKELQPLIARLRAEVRELWEKRLPPLPGGAERWVEAGLRLEDVALVERVWSHPEVSPALRQQARKALTDRLDARLYLGRWLAYPDYKRRLGFELSTPEVELALGLQASRWVSRELVWLVETAAELNRRGIEPRQFPDPLLQDAAAQGKISLHMTKEMILAASEVLHGPEGAMPLRVERFRGRKQEKEVVWELWVLKNDWRICFLNGRAVDKLEVKGEGK